ncbi:MAG: cytochrome c3 family protein [Pseudomonadota bacterium]
MKKLLICLLFILLAVGPFGLVQAMVKGPLCSNCHTMHNSQGGEMVVGFEPFEAGGATNPTLLITTCLGCHTASDPSIWKDATTGAPIVYNVSAPTYGASSDGGTTHQGLAAGNFYWVTQNDANGHNIFSGSPDPNLTVAPGAVTSGCGLNGCHDNLHETNTNFGTRQGCSKCHMMGNVNGPSGYHHRIDTDTVIDSADEGWYRFLAGHMGGIGLGVSGIEDSDWEHETTATHNEYLGLSAGKTSAGSFSACGPTMTGFCCGCHGNFHIEELDGRWIRHPSDVAIQNSGEYANAFGAAGGGTGTYNPLVPVARPSLSAISNTVTLGTDMVMCLSCHRAHASPYYKMLRWDYRGWPGGGTDGCSVCHTSKN